MKKKFLDFYCKLLAFFARKYLKKHKPFVIGINGSVGKTSARMIIYQTLYKFINTNKIYTSSKNFNGELGLSLSVFQIEEFNPTLF
jgi:UDP-N-acetylmuramyl pentapeptide synthase